MTYRLFQMADSGNCYKIRLLASHLGVPLDLVEVDITQGASRTTDFLHKNPNGKVPTLEIETDQYLSESNAILWFLSTDSNLLPSGRLEQAQVLQWFGFEQYSHEPYIATSRYWIKILDAADEYADELDAKRPGGYLALDVMERHLASHEFFVNHYSVADIALFAYTHVANEGGFDLSNYPHINRWLDAVRSQPNFIPIDEVL